MASSQPGNEVNDGSLRRILVIEDNIDAAESMQMMLEIAGYTVAIAHNGADGVAAALRAQPDVVLCDIGLPGELDGYGVARELRAKPAFKSCYLIALTGYGQDDDQRRALDAGFSLHLTKPVDPEALEKLLANLPRD